VNPLIDDLLKYSLSLSGSIGNSFTKTYNYLEIAESYLSYGQKPICCQILKDSLKIVDSLKRPEEKSDRLAWIGKVFALAGEPVQAEEALSRAVLLAGASAPTDVVNRLNSAIWEYLDAGFKEKAEEIIQKLSRAVNDLENDTDKALELVNIAEIYLELDQSEKAEEVLGAAHEISLALKDNWFKAERLIDVAGEYLDIGRKAKAMGVIQEAISAVDSAGKENQAYFWLKIAHLYAAADELSKAFKILTTALNTIKEDESAYSRSKNSLEVAEKYSQLDNKEAAIQITNQALQDIEPSLVVEDKISVYLEIAKILGKLDRKNEALQISNQVFDLSGKVKDKKTLVYLLGRLTLLYVNLHEQEKFAQSVSEILKIAGESPAKNQGLGTVVIELAAAGEFILAFKLVKVIRDSHIKASSITGIVNSLIESRHEPDLEIHEMIKEVIN
jgi:tetratricopeptide (TPR) repeat protein